MNVIPYTEFAIRRATVAANRAAIAAEECYVAATVATSDEETEYLIRQGDALAVSALSIAAALLEAGAL